MGEGGKVVRIGRCLRGDSGWLGGGICACAHGCGGVCVGVLMREKGKEKKKVWRRVCECGTDGGGVK